MDPCCRRIRCPSVPSKPQHPPLHARSAPLRHHLSLPGLPNHRRSKVLARRRSARTAHTTTTRRAGSFLFFGPQNCCNGQKTVNITVAGTCALCAVIAPTMVSRLCVSQSPCISLSLRIAISLHKDCHLTSRPNVLFERFHSRHNHRLPSLNHMFARFCSHAVKVHI